MASTRRPNTIVLRLTMPAVAVAVALTAMTAHSPALAQEGILRRWSLRDLFLPRREPRIDPYIYEEPQVRPRKTIRKAPRKPKAAAVSKPAEPALPVVEKLPDARVVLVIGDFLGAGIAEGLSTVFAENAKIRIVDRTSGSSGFVRDDYYNWPEKAQELIAQEKPAVVVVMLGSNDRQQMRVGENREPAMSPAWMKEYTARAEQFAKTLSDTKVPFLWIGMPAFKSSKMSTDMLAFNDIYRTVTEASGKEFVDVWDGFVDENGAFVTSGPDINGQPVRLRSDDGINVTRAGKRKLAFYAEKPLNKLLGITPQGTEVAVPASLPQATPGELNVPVNIDRTVPVSLSDPELDGGTELMGGQAASPGDPNSPGGKLVVQGVAPAAPPGRVDDFSWPPKKLPAAPGSETTTAIKR
ncbi:SGNH/GDSL hydrolase family protein [Aminobacter sp. BE322]|uniref:SGNH/GDSL hydrolase family protein n=1 Tax=unclassified Aminobacter TaxID=2644704 RepID=UPI003D1A3EB7